MVRGPAVGLVDGDLFLVRIADLEINDAANFFGSIETSIILTAILEMFCLQENCPVLPHTSCLGSLVMPPMKRVLNKKSPSWVKLNAPATGHRIGTGSFPEKKSHLYLFLFMEPFGFFLTY